MHGGRWWRGKWRHFRREPTTSRRRRCGPQPISFVNGIDFRGRVVPPTVHPPTIPRLRWLAAGGSRVHQTWRPLTVGARNGRRSDRCACARGLLVRVRACVHCMRIRRLFCCRRSLFVLRLAGVIFGYIFSPVFYFLNGFFYRRTPDSLKTSRHLRERNVQLHCAITPSVVHHRRRIRTGRVVCAAQRQQYVPVSNDSVPL